MIGRMSYSLYVKGKGDLIAEVSDEQFEQLQSLLVAEDLDDQDFFIDEDTVSFLEGEGVDASLLHELRKALGLVSPADPFRTPDPPRSEDEGSGFDIEWRRNPGVG